jgi:hypothetical protein
MNDKPLMTLEQVKRAMQARGSHFWDRDTMRGFQSRASQKVYPTADGTYFVTSEKDRPFYYAGGVTAAWDGQRRYTVRFCAATVVKETVHGHEYSHERGELVDAEPDAFGNHATSRAAHAAAKRLQQERGGYPKEGT